MWTIFIQVFAEEYHDLVEETKVTSGETRFYLANAMQEIGGALEHLAIVSVADKDAFTRLSEAVEALTQNNVSLTAQISNATKMNLEMDQNLILLQVELHPRGTERTSGDRMKYVVLVH